MYGLSHQFRFIDLIKIELYRSNFLELFGLTLNTTNIETPSVETVGLLVLKLLKALLSGTLLFVSPSFHIYFCCHVYNINGSYFVYLFQQIWL